ncbi:response regulator FixJ [Zavarzinia aquatilis]|uniref:DNA-binding response regulator n=1 Tax=Zavarzinia aquatilis TaxID=2211142 RepID=A0A317EFQ1_9PROT|nr:response regulator FixJ [Zavarzinia aquatilis]PWR25126.1 DNA-binding response regulator [Zavarzinia aquatilis]
MTEMLVHLIDDDDSARDSLAFMLESADFTVQPYPSAQAFLDGLPVGPKGCIITDVRMPELTGIELVHRLNALKVTLPVIVITGHGDIPLAIEAMRAGVVDFIEKPFPEERILEALGLARDKLRTDVDEAPNSEIVEKLGTLSEREREVLDGVVAGRPNKIIARDLGISPRTVEIYRAKVMAKMQADNLAALVRMTMAAGLG